MRPLEGQTALVTGASSGIGARIAIAMGVAGAKVDVVDEVDPMDVMDAGPAPSRPRCPPCPQSPSRRLMSLHLS